MRPTRFAEATAELSPPAGMTREECGHLAVAQTGPEHGMTVSRWVPSWRERLRLLFGEPVWLWVWAGGTTQPPVALEVRPRGDRPFVSRAEVEG